jgi:response regulator RpfG family c-di-GMP phosphodiesterase
MFYALLSTRRYKTASEISVVVNYFYQPRGKRFDPELTDLQFKKLDRFIAIRDRHRRCGRKG